MITQDKYREVIREYKGRAANYDLIHHRFISESQEIALAELKPSRGERILDAGCGTSSLTVSIAQAVGKQGEVVGIDISPDMLRVARQKVSSYKNITLLEANVENIPYSRNYFNAVVSVNTLHYWYNVEVVLKEFYRVLKPYGRIVLVNFCTDYLFFSLVERLWRIFIPAHKKAYAINEVSALLKKVGFKSIAGRRLKIGWFWRSMVIRARR